MLPIQTDVYSDLDHVLAQRLAYALDNSLSKVFARIRLKPSEAQPAQAATLKQAADLLRSFNGRMTTDSPAAAIVAGARAGPLAHAARPATPPPRSNRQRRRRSPPELALPPSQRTSTASTSGARRDYALEQILMHTPPRWLPSPTPPGTTSSPPPSPRPDRRTRPLGPQHLALRRHPYARHRAPHLRAIPRPRLPLRPAHRHRPAAAIRRRHHHQAGRPHLRPLRALHRRPRRPRPLHPQPRRR